MYLYFEIILDPVLLLGEGEYNLNVLKESEVTNSFLSLSKDERKCQNEESYAKCTTRHYIDTMNKKCGCLPISINPNYTVNQNHFF